MPQSFFLVPPERAVGELYGAYVVRNYSFEIPERLSARPFLTINLPFRRAPRADIFVDQDGSYWKLLNAFPVNGGDQETMRRCFQACIEASYQSGLKGGLDDPGRMFSIIEGRPFRRTLEPMLGISIVPHTDGRPPQIEASLVTGSVPPKPCAGSEHAKVFFRLDRRTDMDDVVAAFRATWKNCSPAPQRRDFELSKGAEPCCDDTAISMTAAIPAVLAAGHAILAHLPRGALDTWLSLRAAAKASNFSRDRMAEIAGDLARFGEALVTIRPSGEEDAKWLRRARIHTQILSLRLAAEPDLIPPDPLAGLQL